VWEALLVASPTLVLARFDVFSGGILFTAEASFDYHPNLVSPLLGHAEDTPELTCLRTPPSAQPHALFGRCFAQFLGKLDCFPHAQPGSAYALTVGDRVRGRF
jgi:hypothetical protein